MNDKTISIIILFVFLFSSSSCSHPPKKTVSPDLREEISSSKEIARSLHHKPKEEPWWKKDENQWFLAFLFILGVGIFTSASVWIAYNSGGLYVNVQK